MTEVTMHAHIHIAGDNFDLRQNLKGGDFFGLKSDVLREQTATGYCWECSKPPRVQAADLGKRDYCSYFRALSSPCLGRSSPFTLLSLT